MVLPEGWTHYQLYRESSTDSVATAGLVDDVTATTLQHPFGSAVLELLSLVRGHTTACV